MHRADIVAALRKRGTSLRKLSREHGFAPDTLRHALRRPYPDAERIIAGALHKEPAEIWPSRYESTPRGNSGKSTSQRET
jgi:Ner family transcriptional regulator